MLAGLFRFTQSANATSAFQRRCEKQFPLRQLENLASHFPGRDNGEALEVFLRIASIHWHWGLEL
jgi:hypothetical protein